jgi:hypothetical protein
MTKSKYTQLDAGHTVVNVCCEGGRHGLHFTAYINGLSVKSQSLKLARVVRVFIDTVIAACDFPQDSHSDAHIDRLSDELEVFIDGAYQIENINN